MEGASCSVDVDIFSGLKKIQVVGCFSSDCVSVYPVLLLLLPMVSVRKKLSHLAEADLSALLPGQ